jgi:hypothetical protein
MSAPLSRSDLSSRELYVDWADLEGLDRIVAIYEVGQQSVVVETNEGREIRITAWLDRRADQYVADFERRSVVTNGTQRLHVWAQSPAYARCVADNLQGCLRAAVVAVDRVAVY